MSHTYCLHCKPYQCKLYNYLLGGDCDGIKIFHYKCYYYIKEYINTINSSIIKKLL